MTELHLREGGEDEGGRGRQNITASSGAVKVREVLVGCRGRMLTRRNATNSPSDGLPNTNHQPAL